MPIKGIFFDAADVFYYRTETTGTYARRLLTELGYPSELSTQDEERKTEMRVQATEGRIGHAVYWDRLLLMHGVANPNQRGTLCRRILEHTHDVLAHPGGREAMAGLHARGFVLGLVTDTMYPVEWKTSWMAKVGVAEFIDVVSCSTVLGAHKPEPAIYLNALWQAHLTPRESAFVGHDAGELEGARRAGMVTVAVNYDRDARADYYADSLLGLLHVSIFAGPADEGHTVACIS